MPQKLFLRPVAEEPDGRGLYCVGNWDTPSSESLNEAFWEAELDEMLDAAKDGSDFLGWHKVSNDTVNEEGEIEVPIDNHMTLITTDLRDKIAVPVGVWPQELQYYIFADDDDSHYWCVAYPARVR